MKIKKFTFNSFQENTYLIHSNKECMIIDPGCNSIEEENLIKTYIEENQLIPKELINTHCHLDHIFGNNFIANTYNLIPKMHEKDLPLLNKAVDIAKLYNVSLNPPPLNVKTICENDVISLGNTSWEVIFTPGHAPGHICLINHANKKIISGDVLFLMSIGRTDLPLCNHEDLMNSIKNKLFKLDDEIEVLCGHGENTSIGFEKQNNPFLKIN
ncbi:MAG: MBL fold hydrolase [Flavobacteriales bacterium]|nr:MBL fold hydrolase [Flavobacteriales bacterium]|tara:strand:- start:2900 stop:3538 length:639 start_codon:yes stop_codon:yes gene_type:complete